MEIQPSVMPGNGSYRGISIAEVDPDALAAFLRLVELHEKPEQIPVLAPLIIREIHYRLLVGPQGERLRMVNTHGTQSNQIAKSITWLRDNYKEPLQVDELARTVNMATSTFHRHFREVTTLSPLQFQKRLRLYEAQRMMLAEDQDATIVRCASRRVRSWYLRSLKGSPRSHLETSFPDTITLWNGTASRKVIFPGLWST